jgi:aryl-alcohol dehydrogenase-like predicted oxidoreductase
MSELARYRRLGRSGLRVSPLSLGTMTFGADWGWGADADEAGGIFDHYVDRGGNSIDTAVNYTAGTSERLVGRFVKGKRERLVIATKFTMARDPADPNSGGNHRLNMIRSVEQSLRQLDTDRVDLLYLHAWDFTTAPDEVMRGLDDLVRSGKVVYLGICNTPAWRVSQLRTLADLRGWAPLVALQIEYSLVQRTVEHELLPMAADMGLGVLPWSPLGGGVLTGKYRVEDLTETGDAAVAPTRKGVIASAGTLTARALAIAEVVREVAQQLDREPAQVALAWTLLNAAVVSPVVGARTVEQASSNFDALSVELTGEQRLRLEQASAPEPIFPQAFVGRPIVQQLIFGSAKIRP